MRIRIYFVRHGEAESNVNPLFEGVDTLTETGAKQAKQLAERFKDIPVETLYTSKILRAQLTAEVVETVTKIKPEILEFIGERKCGYSKEIGTTYIETFEDLTKRLIETKNFLEKATTKHIVVVSHALFLKALISYLTLGDLLTEELCLKMTNTITIDNTAVTKFVFDTEKNKWRLEFLNDQTHIS